MGKKYVITVKESYKGSLSFLTQADIRMCRVDCTDIFTQEVLKESYEDLLVSLTVCSRPAQAKHMSAGEAHELKRRLKGLNENMPFEFDVKSCASIDKPSFYVVERDGWYLAIMDEGESFMDNLKDYKYDPYDRCTRFSDKEKAFLYAQLTGGTYIPVWV